MQVLWTEMGLGVGSDLDAATWESFMVQFIRRQSERDANLFVVVPSTPAQYFHVLRRQANLPYKRPLICLARLVSTRPAYTIQQLLCTPCTLDALCMCCLIPTCYDGSCGRAILQTPHTLPVAFIAPVYVQCEHSYRTLAISRKTGGHAITRNE